MEAPLTETGKVKEEQMSGRKAKCFFSYGLGLKCLTDFQVEVSTVRCVEELREDYLRNINFANDFICNSPKHMLSYISLLLFF